MRQVFALSVLTGEEHPIDLEELATIFAVPAHEWIPEEGFEGDVGSLVEKGILLRDEGVPREREERLEATQWNLYGALYHFLTRWSGVDLSEAVGEELPAERFLEEYGPPPPAFAEPRGPVVQELPLVERRGGLYDALLARRTTRGFDRRRSLALDELSVVLRYVFGCHGYAPIAGDLVALRKTSPSGGALHPVEVFPLVTRVKGLAPGLYHYGVRDHVLELVEPLDEAEAVELAGRFVCGQTYFGSAHVMFVLAARFDRSFWKYRRHQRVLAALYMDAAHLSQTLYLVCVELGLGAYVTAAVNAADIDRRLGLDGVTEGTLAVTGCGHRLEASAFEPEFLPFTPRAPRTPPRAPRP